MTRGSDPSASLPDTQESSLQQLVCKTIDDWLRSEGQATTDPIDYDASLLEFGIDSVGVATIAGELERETGKIVNL